MRIHGIVAVGALLLGLGGLAGVRADPGGSSGDPGGLLGGGGSWDGLTTTPSPTPSPVPVPPSPAATFAAILRGQPPGAGLDRHALGARVRSKTPTPGVRTLIVALEGTGAYEPRMAPLLLEGARRLGPPANPADFYGAASSELEKFLGREPHWSALLRGPLCNLLADPGMLSGPFDWASFPSEEAELLAGLDSLSVANLRKLKGDVERSRKVEPQGVMDALAFLRHYRAAALGNGDEPKLVVLSHSSGGRAAVKLLEHWKPLEVDLVLTIDPVKEAHEALGELLPQMLGQGSNYNARKLPGVGRLLDKVGVARPVLPRVWSRSQPHKLYKVGNARRWVSLYQTDDTEGLKISPHHGIQGSPLHGADREVKVPVGTSDGHGAIGYHSKTLEVWREELGRLHGAP